MSSLDSLLSAVFRHSYVTQPGFILERFGRKALRNSFLSETAVAEVEKKAVEKLGEEMVYGVGKEFGYNYAKMLDFPSGQNPLKDEILKNLVSFFETTYGSNSSYKADWQNKKFEIHGKNVIVDRKNGLGLLIYVGGWAGLLAFLLRDKQLEAVQPKCEGRGDDECLLIIGEAETLNKTESVQNVKNKIYRHADFQEKSYGQDYAAFNNPIPFKPDYGLDALLQVGMMKYTPNVFDAAGERFFPIEITLWYSFEKEIAGKADLNEIAYEPTRTAFESFAKNNLKQKFNDDASAIAFAAKLFSAFGWGINQTLPGEKNKVFVNGFPWSPELDAIKIPQYYLGSLDGFVSGATGKKMRSKLSKTDKRMGAYNLELEYWFE